MAHDSSLPCDGDGRCMICKLNPPEEEKITCKTCVTPWHLDCLSSRPQTLADAAQWECPDCTNLVSETAPPATGAAGSEPSALVAAIRAIESDASLSDVEKARRRQQLMSGGADDDKKEAGGGGGSGSGSGNDVLKLLSGSFNCSFCMQLPERPVTTPCGHNFCLKCFEKWVGQGKKTCAICRTTIPAKMASNPRINSSLVIAIRMAKMTKSNAASGPPKLYYSVLNQNKPDKAYTTERAKKTGKANACSGKIFVTVPPDHFGPILAENDPERGMGVMVGETWEDRLECRQWGAHLPHVAGICGQSDYGAQSVALSGGYEDDEDHGEWFLYTGSGGRDLSGNKRTNKTQSFDQKFDKSNEALRVSCKKGYPVRVVRSHKEKRSAYAPEQGVRYDGVYRIEKCWRKPGIQGYKVCRYLFVRCDNDPAPWTSDENGDRPRPLPVIKELKDASDVTERKGSPSWDYDEEKACWLWKIPPPVSKKQTSQRDAGDGTQTRVVRRKTKMMSVSERLLKEFCCLICHKVMSLPLTTPCAHNFCKSCLQDTFVGQTFIRERNCEGRRSLRAQKNVMKCPSCTNDISEYLQNPQVNRELMSVIETLQRQIKESEENAGSEEEKLNEDEKNDVKEEDKDDMPEAEEKDVCSEAKEDIKESDEDVVIAKSSPEANKKRKAADVTENAPGEKLHEETDNDNNKIIKDTDVNSGLVESEEVKAEEVAKRGKKGSKKKKDDGKCSSPKANNKRKAADVTEDAPGEKLHVETDNDSNNQITKDMCVNSDLVESEDLKANEVAKRGKKGSKKKKDDDKCSSPKANKKSKAADATENTPGEMLHEDTDNDNNQLTKDTGANSGLVETEELKADEVVKRGKKGAKKKKDDGKRKAADVTENALAEKLHEGTDNDSNNQITKDTGVNSELVESEDLKAAEVAKRGKKGSKKKDDGKCSSPKVNKKRKAADVTENAPSEKLHEETDTKDTGVNSGLVESEDLKVDEVAKRGKKGSKKKKDDQKCSSPAGAGAGARTRSRKA